MESVRVAGLLCSRRVPRAAGCWRSSAGRHKKPVMPRELLYVLATDDFFCLSLRADLASYLSCEKDASYERCFLHLVVAFSEMLLWERSFVCSVLPHEGAVGRQHREWGCVRGLGGLYQAQQVAEGKQEVSLAILGAAVMSVLIDVKDGHTHTKGV